MSVLQKSLKDIILYNKELEVVLGIESGKFEKLKVRVNKPDEYIELIYDFSYYFNRYSLLVYHRLIKGERNFSTHYYNDNFEPPEDKIAEQIMEANEKEKSAWIASQLLDYIKGKAPEVAYTIFTIKEYVSRSLDKMSMKFL